MGVVHGDDKFILGNSEFQVTERPPIEKCPLGSLLYGLSEHKEDVSASRETDVY